MRRRILLVGLLCSLALLAGCLGDSGEASEEKQATLDALDDVSTYQFQTDSSTTARAEGSGPAAGATLSSEQQISGVVDREARTMALDVTSTRSISGGPQSQPPSESRQRVLIADDTVYVGQYDQNDTLQWVRGERRGISDTVWNSQEPASQLRTVLAASSVSVAGEETVDGRDATVLDLDINATAYQQVVREQLNGSGLGGTSFGRAPTEVRDLDIQLVTAENGTPIRSDLTIEVAVTQQSQGGQAGPSRSQTIVRQTNATTTYSAQGEAVDVTVPDAALNATTIAERQAERRQALQNRTDSGATAPSGGTAQPRPAP